MFQKRPQPHDTHSEDRRLLTHSHNWRPQSATIAELQLSVFGTSTDLQTKGHSRLAKGTLQVYCSAVRDAAAENSTQPLNKLVVVVITPTTSVHWSSLLIGCIDYDMFPGSAVYSLQGMSNIWCLSFPEHPIGPSCKLVSGGGGLLLFRYRGVDVCRVL